MALAVAWNRSRATALAVTLALHVVVALWLLSLRFDWSAMRDFEAEPLWLPLPAPAPPPLPREADAPSARPRATAPELRLEPVPDLVIPPVLPDWYGTARDVAGARGGAPGRRSFGEAPQAPEGRPKEETPPSIWKEPLPRVGTTVTTPEGETIIWVSDYCYVTVGTRSLTLDHIHQGRMGVRTCILYQFGGEKKPRSDLLDPIKRP